MTAQQDMVTYLSEIANRSRAGGIQWRRANPSTYVWQQGEGGISNLVSIQKATTRGIPEYQFTVTKVVGNTPTTPVLSLSTGEKPYLRGPLDQVFQAAEGSFDVQSANVLKDLLS